MHTCLPHPSDTSSFLPYNCLEDCFFEIPFTPQDRNSFTFTVWEPNMHRPAQRYQWIVLPQGIKNSSSICQLYIAQTLINVPKGVFLVPYMDDLLSHLNKKYLQKVADLLFQDLASLKIMMLTEKVQRMPPFSILKFSIAKDIQPLTFKL